VKKSELISALKEMPHLSILTIEFTLPLVAKEYAERYFIYQPVLSGVDIVREYLRTLWAGDSPQFDKES